MFMRLMLGIALLGIAACSTTTKLVNRDGQERYCHKEHAGGWDMIPASQEYNHCLNEAGKDGFQIAK